MGKKLFRGLPKKLLKKKMVWRVQRVAEKIAEKKMVWRVTEKIPS